MAQEEVDVNIEVLFEPGLSQIQNCVTHVVVHLFGILHDHFIEEYVGHHSEERHK